MGTTELWATQFLRIQEVHVEMFHRISGAKDKVTWAAWLFYGNPTTF